MFCSACGTKVPANAKFCASCGQAMDSDTGATLVDHEGSFEGETISPPASTSREPPSRPAPFRHPRPTPTPLTSSDPIGGGRFTPGQILAERYRIVALAGRGGMGEVFRADDLTLGQIVAMKFLPERLSQDAARSRGSTPRCETPGRSRTRTFVPFLLRLAVKKDWIAAIVIVFLGAVGNTGATTFGRCSPRSSGFPSIWCLRRFALLALVVGLVVQNTLVAFPMTTPSSCWYASGAIAGLVTVVAVAFFAMYHALAGQPLFSSKALDD